MKFSAWQMVAILAILFAAIICAHLFAPGATATVVSMVTTLFAALFLQRESGESEKAKPELEVIQGGKE